MRRYVYMGSNTADFTHGYVYRLLGLHNESGKIAMSNDQGDCIYITLDECRKLFVKMESIAA
jgi:hypothetical protein